MAFIRFRLVGCHLVDLCLDHCIFSTNQDRRISFIATGGHLLRILPFYKCINMMVYQKWLPLPVIIAVAVVVAAIFGFEFLALSQISVLADVADVGRSRCNSRKLLRQLQEALTHLHTHTHLRVFACLLTNTLRLVHPRPGIVES